MTTAINDYLQTVKVDVFDAEGARLNEGWGDVTKTTLTESVPGGRVVPRVPAQVRRQPAGVQCGNHGPQYKHPVPP